MIAFKSNRRSLDPGSDLRDRREATQGQVDLNVRAAHRGDGRSCLVGKGCLFHVEAEANASRRSLQPTAEGLETRELSRSGAGTGPQGCADPAGDGRRAGNGSRRRPVDAAAVRAGRAQCGRDQRRRLHAVDRQHCRNRSTRSPSRARSRRRPGWSARSIPNPNNANAKVFFQNLIVTPTGELGKIDQGQVSNFRTVQNGILAIDMPNFYLAHTETTKPSTRIADSHHRPCRPARSTSRRA